MVYLYFISGTYTVGEGRRDFQATVERKTRIRTSEDLKGLQADLKEGLAGRSLVILNYKLIDEEGFNLKEYLIGVVFGAGAVILPLWLTIDSIIK